jgi:hypothetical protein
LAARARHARGAFGWRGTLIGLGLFGVLFSAVLVWRADGSDHGVLTRRCLGQAAGH